MHCGSQRAAAGCVTETYEKCPARHNFSPLGQSSRGYSNELPPVTVPLLSYLCKSQGVALTEGEKNCKDICIYIYLAQCCTE